MFFRRQNPWRGLEKQLGYRFKDRALLLAALTHPSCRPAQLGAPDNQRLEYLGDAVLGLLAAEHVYASRRDAHEGQLTVLRSNLISGRTLAEVARSVDLGVHLRLGTGEERGGGRERGGALADALEAVFGAAWLDGGLRAVRKMFARLFADKLAAEASAAGKTNPKGAIQEWAQRVHRVTPVYTLAAVEGPAHAPRYRTEVRVGGETETGEGPSIRVAEAAAAARLLARVEKG